MKICVVGLGYVGLPLFLELAKSYDVFGYDVDAQRVLDLKNGEDRNCEIPASQLVSVSANIHDNIKNCSEANIYIVTVPTPITAKNKPDLILVQSATEKIAQVLKTGDIVVSECTVYPGVTEDIMAPILEKISGLTFNEDFFMGYSPERINPGDTVRTIDKIVKVVSGSTPKTLDVLSSVYLSVTSAGVYKAPSIRIAEAAKVIENTQRDLNIALMNELNKIFTAADIDIHEVLSAAETKWNFHPYKPGMVGGHCIGVDPYYLTYFAEQNGVKPEVVLSGRNINDSMSVYYANQVLKFFGTHECVKNSNPDVLIAGITFKENCADLRNSKAIDFANELDSLGFNVSVVDTRISGDRPNGLSAHVKVFGSLKKLGFRKFSGVILAVPHKEFTDIEIWKNLIEEDGHIFDLKAALKKTPLVKRI